MNASKCQWELSTRFSTHRTVRWAWDKWQRRAGVACHQMAWSSLRTSYSNASYSFPWDYSGFILSIIFSYSFKVRSISYSQFMLTSSLVFIKDGKDPVPTPTSSWIFITVEQTRLFNTLRAVHSSYVRHCICMYIQYIYIYTYLSKWPPPNWMQQTLAKNQRDLRSGKQTLQEFIETIPCPGKSCLANACWCRIDFWQLLFSTQQSQGHFAFTNK